MERRVRGALNQLEMAYYYAMEIQRPSIVSAIRASLPPQYQAYFAKMLLESEDKWKAQGGTDFELCKRDEQSYASSSGESYSDEPAGDDEKDKESKDRNNDDDSKENEGEAGVEEAHLDGGFEMVENAGKLMFP